jgi:hypothetical protein
VWFRLLVLYPVPAQREKEREKKKKKTCQIHPCVCYEENRNSRSRSMTNTPRHAQTSISPEDPAHEPRTTNHHPPPSQPPLPPLPPPRTRLSGPLIPVSCPQPKSSRRWCDLLFHCVDDLEASNHPRLRSASGCEDATSFPPPPSPRPLLGLPYLT